MSVGLLTRVFPPDLVDEVVARPLHPYTRGLMASTPMATPPGERLNQIPGAMPRLDAIPEGCAFHPRCPVAEAGCYIGESPTVEGCGGRAACWLVARGEVAA